MTKSRGVLGPRVPWTPEQDALLRERYATTLTVELAELVGHTLSSTHQRARKLDLVKSLDFIAEIARERTMQPDHGGRAHQFKPGVPSWSKGVKGRVGVQEACKATQFKKGRPPQEARNYQPIGATRVCADDYLERKVTDDPTIAPARRWVAVHRLVWIAANGPIPEGHAVVFRAGQRTTVEAEITVDRLELLTRRELMLRNTYHRYGPEIARVVQLRGAITRQINKRMEKDDHEQEHQ
jgi:hypothetical protein